MIKLRVAGIATLVEPCAAASATAELAGLVKGSALETGAGGYSTGGSRAALQGGDFFARGIVGKAFLHVCSWRAHNFPGGSARVGFAVYGPRPLAFEESWCAWLAFRIAGGR